METKKLLTIDDAESLTIDEVWSSYRQYVSSSQVDLIGSFLFGRELAASSEGCYIFTKDNATNKKQHPDLSCNSHLRAFCGFRNQHTKCDGKLQLGAGFHIGRAPWPSRICYKS